MSTPSLTSERFDFEDALGAVEFYYEKGWTDGLPVKPPTPRQVEDMLAYSGRQPSEILGAEPTKGKVVTAEKVAINAVMAGCLPEYFPVVAAAVEAMCEPRFNLHAVTVSTMGSAILAIVNGPVREAIGLNSGVGAFGPGYRANATIGRAIRLVVSNVTGAVPGVLDKGTLGHGGKYSWCVAEAEKASPWAPMHVDRGFDSEQSAVTVFAGLSPIPFVNGESTRPEDILLSARDALFASGQGHDELVVVLCPEHVGHIRDAGWSKRQVQEQLHSVGTRRGSEWAAAGAPAPEDRPDPDSEVSVATDAYSYKVVVAGGAAGGFSAVVPLWGGGSNSIPVIKEVRTPRA